MAIQRDETFSAGRNRGRDLGCPTAPANGVKYATTGTIYYESRIGHRGLYDGWRPVQMGVNSTAGPPVGLSPWPVYGAHDRFALKLSTGERTYGGGNVDNQCTTWRGVQLSAIKERFLKYSAHVALHDGVFSNSFDSFTLALDMQTQDNSQRSLAQFAVRATNIGDLTHPYLNLSISGNGPSHTFVDIPSSGDLFPGQNEGKQTLAYMAMVWDRQATPTTGGYGRIHSVQVGASVFDLTGTSFQSSVGSSSEPPQLPDPTAHTIVEDFRDTVNCGLILNRSTSGTNTNVYPATAKVSGIVLSGHALGA